MDERAFVQQRQASWRRLSDTLDIVRRAGLRSLSGRQASALASDYREVVSDLARARTEGASTELHDYLNELAGRGHGALYAARGSRISSIVRFLFGEFPRACRAQWRYPAAAMLLFGIGAAAGVYAVGAGFKAAPWLAPTGLQPAELSSFIMTNNIKVAILAFAAGVTAGLGTALVLLVNGVQLAIVAASQTGEPSRQLWTFVAGHGVIELTAIFIAGGAGLKIGSAIIAPGNLRRSDAFAGAATVALRLFAGTIPMLVVAGVIEGFISPSPLPRAAKWAFSALTLLTLLLYFGFAGKRSTDGTATVARVP